VDPVSHAIFGRVIVAALDSRESSRFGKGTGRASILASLSPDIDCVLMPLGWDIYLRWHEVGTHSLAGAFVTGVLSAGVVGSTVRGAQIRRLLAPGLAAAATHLLLDALSGARVGLWWPIATTRTRWPLVAMAEPWLLGLLVVGAILTWWSARPHRPAVARSALLAVTLLFTVKASLLGKVHRELAVRGDVGVTRVLDAVWTSWTKWYVYEKDASSLRTALADAQHGISASLLVIPNSVETELETRSRALDSVGNFLSVHDLAFVTDRTEQSGEHTILWSDIRYCWPAASSTTLDGCGLWFGGRFDRTGHPLKQIVQVGGWTQTREVSP
jgi:membrane-bound metal-dependent hydrolase YbcI (DUF457 family)